jgi:hypothetical protein
MGEVLQLVKKTASPCLQPAPLFCRMERKSLLQPEDQRKAGLEAAGPNGSRDAGVSGAVSIERKRRALEALNPVAHH